MPAISLLDAPQCNSEGHYSEYKKGMYPPHNRILAYTRDGKTYWNLDAIDYKLNRNQHRCKMVNDELKFIEAPAQRQKRLDSIGNF